MRAVVCKNGKTFTGIAFEGQDAYNRNVRRGAEFITPIIVPKELDPSDVVYALNEGKKRILKTGVDILIGETSVKHMKLSKG